MKRNVNKIKIYYLKSDDIKCEIIIIKNKQIFLFNLKLACSKIFNKNNLRNCLKHWDS